MPKKITSKHFAIKRTKFGGITTVDFKPKMGNKTTIPPNIETSHVDDTTGEVIHTLDNGNTMSAKNYERYWGKPKI